MRLHDYLIYHASVRPGGEFAVQGDRRLTYAEGAAGAHRVANALVAAGLEDGDRIAILSKNSIEYVLLYFGASEAGVVPVPLNYRLAPPEWRYIIEDAGARLVIAAAEFTEGVDGVRDGLSADAFWAIGAEGTAGWEDFAACTAAQPATPPDRLIMPSHDAYQMYTSGTTGRPRGAVLTHHAVSSNIAQMMTAALGIEPDRRSLIVAPMYHAAAGIIAFSTVASGGSLYLQEDFVPTEAVRALDEEGIALTLLVPAMIQACLVAVPDIAAREFRDLRTVAYGASPIAGETLRAAARAFKCDLVQGYGMTEATAVITLLSAEDHERALRDEPGLLLAAGKPVLGTELRIVDEDDQPLPAGAVGEIVARGPQLMRGYWELPDESAEALRGGWLHTGDAGRLDEAGYLYIQDRVKDMIVSGGENVYPNTVEQVLFEHPAVADVAVIGVPDDQWGETVKAIVVLRPEAGATEAELIRFCEGRLGGFERPHSIDFVDALPRNPSGKVLKRELREPYWVGQVRRVSGV